MTRPADFRAVARRGRRTAGHSTVVQVLVRGDADPSRFGFVVSKAVGNAVTRNLIRRRMRAVGADALTTMARGTDVVVRALPASVDATWATLHTEITEGVTRGVESS